MWALKHHRAASVLLKISRHITIRKDGWFTFSTGKPFSPEDAKIIDNIKADHTIKHLDIERDEKGRFRRMSGYVGGY